MLLDSNIIIYAVRPEHESLRSFLSDNPIVVSAITRVEVLGYHRLAETERHTFEEFFRALPVLPVTECVLDESIRLRQLHRMTLGDSLIAATAIVHCMRLATHIISDFSWIEGLDVIDPVSNV